MASLEKKIFVSSLVLMLLFLGLTIYAFWGLSIRLPSCVTGIEPFTQGQLIEKTPGKYELHYVAHMWYFDPPQIELPEGAEVDIYLNSADVVHGFQIIGTNVNLMAVPGAVNYAKVKFKHPGTYRIVCHEYCGLGHQNMAAHIRVQG